MPSIRAQGNAYEIRECVSTASGPRQRSLARFSRILTPDVLDRAAGAARKPFDREALLARARQRGIPVAESLTRTGARRLIASLRQGVGLDPMLVALLREALSPLEGRSLPEHLSDAAEWLGQTEATRGRALRGLLRTAGRVARSRGALREATPDVFPRFSSGEGFG